jgi:NRPS condensation-like uncharacterized protein
VSQQALEDAVNKMLLTYPQFRVRIEWDETGVHDSTTEGAAEVPVKVYPRESEDYWIKVLNIEHAIPLRPTVGPLTRFILVKGEEVSELIVFCHHTICDGRSLELALREVLLHLDDSNREPAEFIEAPSQTLDTMPKGSDLGWFKRWVVGKINQKWEKEKVLFDEEDLQNVWEAFWKISEYKIETIEFTEKETQRLVELSRENEVTLNSTLLIALLKSRIDSVGPYEGKAKVATAVDARHRLRVDCTDAVGFYAGGSFTKFDYNGSKSFWDNVREYHKAVTKDLESNKIFDSVVSHFYMDQTLVDAMGAAFFGEMIEPHQSRYKRLSEYAAKTDGMVPKYLEKIGDNAPDIISTNLGRLSIPDEISGIKVERTFFTPSAGQKMELVLGIATIADKLTITLNYYPGIIEGDRIKAVRDRAEEMLMQLVSS